jgi:rare lipoprotein A
VWFRGSASGPPHGAGQRASPWPSVGALGIGALLVLTLAGCGTTPTSRKGGFYQDDGPPDKTLTDPNQLADAVPRIEPFHAYANRPYSALGRSYRPMTEDKPYRARGLASWYGRQFHGSRTSSGEIYDMFAATAAHTTLPIPSYVRVTNTRTGASLIVRVNDRGPFKPDRVIDLSYAAAVKLGIASAGTGEVEVVRLTFDDIRSMRGADAARAPAATAAPLAQAPAAGASAVTSAQGSTPSVAPVTPPAPAVATVLAPAPSTTAPLAPSSPATASVPPLAAAASAPLPGAAADSGRWAVQVGAFQQQSNADAMRDRVAVQMQQAGSELAALRPPRVELDGSIFRVLVGAVADRASALVLAQQLERLLGRETLPLMR